MSDTVKYIENERGRFRLHIWETNKGFYLGAKRWDVCKYIVDFGWYRLERQAGEWNSPDRADRDGEASLKHWSENYDPKGIED